MRHLLIIVAASAALLAACASAPEGGPTLAPAGCDALRVSVANGTLNGMQPTASMAEIKAQFPCSTGDTEEGSDFNCGGGVFFLKHDFYAYSHRDYFEFRGRFPGQFDVPLLGLPYADVQPLLGEPARTEVDEDSTFYLFERPWGTLRVVVSGGFVITVGLHGTAPAATQLCL